MPRVKIDYVVSFSSEDPDNPASNLLTENVSGRRWLLPAGASSGSVVLQLARATKLQSLSVCAHNVALLEVLVGRAETPAEQYKVLVPSCVLLSPTDSRRESAVERVRTFSMEQLAADVRGQLWDRLKVVCSQPYNKHVKFGLSFIHLFSPEPALKLALDVASSDDEDIRPGQLFAKYLATKNTTNTDAQIRQASSQAIKNISDSATKLVKTPIVKDKNKNEQKHSKIIEEKAKDRNNVIYNDDDGAPNNKIDKVVQRHRDERTKEIENKKEPEKMLEKNKDSEKRLEKRDKSSKEISSKADKNGKKESSQSRDSEKNKERLKTKSSDSQLVNSDKYNGDKGRGQKRRRSNDDSSLGDDCDPSCMFEGVVFVMSGYENPRRGHVRDILCAGGGTYRRDWGHGCTHLICAFPNTPKLRQVRASPAGHTAVVVRAEWVEQSYRRGRRLGVGRFMVEGACGSSDTECDTDDEIEKVLKKQKASDSKKQKGEENKIASESKKPKEEDHKKNENNKKQNENKNKPNTSRESDVSFVKDERYIGNVTVDDDDDDKTMIEDDDKTNENDDKAIDNDDKTIDDDEKTIDDDDDKTIDGEITTNDIDIDESKSLPAFLDGLLFLIDDSVVEDGFDVQLIERYVKAYGGQVVQEYDSSAASSTVSLTTRRHTEHTCPQLRPEWLWECHEEGARVGQRGHEVES